MLKKAIHLVHRNLMWLQLIGCSELLKCFWLSKEEDSSASGYTNGLALLLFGRKNEQPMKVSPWSSYQLVEHEFEPEPQSTTRKTQSSGGCISFNCFKHAHAHLDGQTPSEICLVKQSELSTDISSNTSKTTASDTCYKSDRKPCQDKLKKPSGDCSTYEEVDTNELIEQTETEASCCTVGRKVQWTDKCGKELVEVREFELRLMIFSIVYKQRNSIQQATKIFGLICSCLSCGLLFIFVSLT